MPHTITFAQQKGGSGKTTLLVQLAQGLLNRGCSVALVDLDPQASLSRWAALRNDPALTATHSSDWKASSDIRNARRAHDIVLVDCPGNADILLRATIRDSDLILSPCQPSAMDIWALAPVVDMAVKEKTPIYTILNRVPPRGDIEAALTELQTPILNTRIGNRIAYAKAFGRGKSAAEIAPRSKSAEEAEHLTNEVLALLETL